MLRDTGDDKKQQVGGGGSATWPIIYDPGLDFATPQLQRMTAVWREKRGARAMPSRDDFALRDLTFVLPNISVLQVVHEGSTTRFRVRLQGSELDSYTGPMTGKFIDEAVSTKFAEKWAGPWLRALGTREPMRSIGRVEFGDRAYFIAESFAAPLAVDGETADALLIGVYYHLAEGEPGQSGIAQRLVRELNAAA